MTISRSLIAIAAALLGLAAVPAVAMAACKLSGPGACHDAFEELTAVAPDGREGFAAVGRLIEPAGPGGETGILRFDISNRTRVVAVEPPENPTNDGRPIHETDARDIARLVGGDFLIAGTVSFGEGDDLVFHGWAAAVRSDGSTRWSTAYPGPPGTDELFHFGRLSPNGDAMVGGRVQTGPGDGRCSNWSKGLVDWLDPLTGKRRRSQPLLIGTETNRMAFYGGNHLPDGSMVFTGFLAQGQNGQPCVDRAVVVQTDWSGSNGKLLPGPIGGVENEIGQDIEVYGNQIVAVGTTFNNNFGAFALLLPADGSGQPLLQSFSHGQAGRDRFTGIEQDPQSGNYWTVGFWSDGARDPNKAWWALLGETDLSVVDSAEIADYPRSTLNGVATLPGGRTLTVGYVSADDDSPQYGYSILLAEGVKTGLQIGSERRPVDTSLRSLADLPRANGAYTLGDIKRGAGFQHGTLAAGEKVAIDFAAKGGLRVLAHTERGNLDLVLTRPDGTLVDFSNNRVDANEIIEQAAASGEYRLEVVARSDVSAFDLTLAPVEPVATYEGAAANVDMTREERLMVGTILGDFGYFPGSEMAIAVSPEAVRSFMALQDATGEPVSGLILDSDLLAALQ